MRPVHLADRAAEDVLDFGECQRLGFLLWPPIATAFVMFWLDFIIGNDWTVAAPVAVALFGTRGLTHAGIAAWWLLTLCVLAVTAVCFGRAVEREHRLD